MTWALYKELKYDTDGIPNSNLTDFPKRFKITADTDIAAELSGGGGIKVTSADGMTDLPIEVIGSGTDLASGDVELWTKLSLLSSASVGDVMCRLYYSSSESTTEDHAGVWSNGYVLVMHLEEDPSGSSPQMYDSVSESNVGTSAGSMTSGDLVAGQIGNALDLDGSDDSITFSGVSVDPLTVEACVYPDALPGTVVGNTAFGNALVITTFSVNLRMGNSLVGVFPSNNFTTGSWQSIAVTVDSGDTLTAYRNGTSEGTASQVGTPLALNAIGEHNGGGFDAYWNGLIDEVRISSVARSADWLACAYLDDFANEDTFTLSAEMGGGGGTLYTKDFTADQGSATTLTRLTSKGLTGTQGTATALANLCGKGLTDSQGTSSTLANATSKALTGTQGTSTSIAKGPAKGITAGQGCSTTIVKDTSKPFTATQETSTEWSYARVVLLLFEATQGLVTALTRLVGKGHTATQATTTALVKDTSKPLTATQGTSTSFSATRLVTLLFEITQGTTTALTKLTGKGLAATQSLVTSLAKLVSKAWASTQSLASLFSKLYISPDAEVSVKIITRVNFKYSQATAAKLQHSPATRADFDDPNE